MSRHAIVRFYGHKHNFSMFISIAIIQLIARFIHIAFHKTNSCKAVSTLYLEPLICNTHTHSHTQSHTVTHNDVIQEGQ